MDDELIKEILEARKQNQAVRANAETTDRLAPHVRLRQLFDADSFVEYGQLAGRTSAVDDPVLADGLVGGVGDIEGSPVVAVSYDAAMAAGTQSERNQRKFTKLLYLSVEHRWPFVCFSEGAGGRDDEPLASPPIAVVPRSRFDVLDGLAEMSGWAPTVAVVSGHCGESHASIAMMCDFVVATRSATISAHGGPEVNAQVYAKRGNADLIVDGEADAIVQVRRLLAMYLRTESAEFEPGEDAADIADIIPENRRSPYDMRKVMHALVDKDSVLELSSTWGRSMLTAMARMGGRTIGIYANQPKSPLGGAIDAAAADKAARFVELCDAYDFPIVSLIDNPGYMVGPKAEDEGIARHHARPLAALHHRTVPLYAVQLRKAYGLGPYAMSGWGSARRMPELRLAWPSVESGGMSLEGAAYLVKRKEIQAAKSKEEALAIRDAYAEQMRESSLALKAARSLQFDDVIPPAETRDLIISMLSRAEIPDRRTMAQGGVKKHAIDLR